MRDLSSWAISAFVVAGFTFGSVIILMWTVADLTVRVTTIEDRYEQDDR